MAHSVLGDFSVSDPNSICNFQKFVRLNILGRSIGLVKRLFPHLKFMSQPWGTWDIAA